MRGVALLPSTDTLPFVCKCKHDLFGLGPFLHSEQRPPKLKRAALAKLCGWALFRTGSGKPHATECAALAKLYGWALFRTGSRKPARYGMYVAHTKRSRVHVA